MFFAVVAIIVSGYEVFFRVLSGMGYDNVINACLPVYFVIIDIIAYVCLGIVPSVRRKLRALLPECCGCRNSDSVGVGAAGKPPSERSKIGLTEVRKREP